MSRISRLVVLVTSVTALVSAMAGTASAITWDVSGNGIFTATAPPGTLSSTGASISCATWSVSGTYASGAFPGATYSGITGAFTFTGCTGPVSLEITCGYRLTATTQPTVTVVTGNIDLTCGVTVASTGQKFCHIAGSPHAVYTDRPAPTLDTLTLTTSTLSLGGPSCFLGVNDTASLSHLTFTMIGPGPHIVRTA